MKTIYIECNTGIAGDMIGAALLEIYGDREGFIKMINSAGIDGVEFRAEDNIKCGIKGTKLRVLVNGEEENAIHHHSHHTNAGEHIHSKHEEHEHTHKHEEHTHHHTSYLSILDKINSYNIPEQVKKDAAAVYRIIGEAEARVHGRTLDNIHFHEVGTLDAVADVICSCWLISLIGAQRIICSPVCTGSGTVKCAHGILSVPAPAVCEIMKGVPMYSGSIRSELCTPTGAALVKYFTDEFGTMPIMSVEKVGNGMGTKEFEQANCVRVFFGETEEKQRESVSVIRCNIDDMTGEEMGYATEKLMEDALDVFTIPVYMKKNRPGIMLVCVCENEKREDMIRMIFKHTSTRGVRYSEAERAKLESTFYERDTKYGAVRIKKSEGFGTLNEKPEFEDLRRLADKNGAALNEIRREIK